MIVIVRLNGCHRRAKRPGRRVISEGDLDFGSRASPVAGPDGAVDAAVCGQVDLRPLAEAFGFLVPAVRLETGPTALGPRHRSGRKNEGGVVCVALGALDDGEVKIAYAIQAAERRVANDPIKPADVQI